MAISSDIRRSGPFIGTGKETVFPFSFKIISAEHVSVLVSTDGGVTEKALSPSAFTVSLNADQDNQPGGSVTLVDPLPADSRLSVISDAPYLQPMVLTNRGGFYPETLNDSADSIVIQTQQLKEQLSRAVKVPATSTDTPEDLAKDLYDARDRAEAADKSAAASASASASSAATSKEYADKVTAFKDDIVTVSDNIADVQTAAANATAIKGIGENLTEVLKSSQYAADAKHWAEQASAIAGSEALMMPGATQALNIGQWMLRKAQVFHSVAEMKASMVLADGMSCVTEGYYEPGDGGMGFYRIRPMTASDTADGGSLIALQGGLCAELIMSGVVYPRCFGARGGDNDDTIPLQAMLDFASSHPDVHTIDGCNERFMVGSAIIQFTYKSYPHKGLWLKKGKHVKNLNLKLRADAEEITTLLMCETGIGEEYLIENSTFDGSYGEVAQSTIGYGDGGRHCLAFIRHDSIFASDFLDCGNITIRNCRIHHPDAYGVMMTPSNCTLRVEDCDFITNGPCVLTYATTSYLRGCTAKVEQSYKTMVLNFAHDEIEFGGRYSGSYEKNIYVEDCTFKGVSGASRMVMLEHRPQLGVNYGDIHIRRCKNFNSEKTFLSYLSTEKSASAGIKPFIRNLLLEDVTGKGISYNSGVSLANTNVGKLTLVRTTLSVSSGSGGSGDEHTLTSKITNIEVTGIDADDSSDAYENNRGLFYFHNLDIENLSINDSRIYAVSAYFRITRWCNIQNLFIRNVKDYSGGADMIIEGRNKNIIVDGYTQENPSSKGYFIGSWGISEDQGRRSIRLSNCIFAKPSWMNIYAPDLFSDIDLINCGYHESFSASGTVRKFNCFDMSTTTEGA